MLAAIAAGSIDAVMQDYADDAYMDWVGEALEGCYRGKTAIRGVWEKFFAINHGKPRPAKAGALESCPNPPGTSLAVVAEGAETADELEWLAANDCDAAQGFHIARPMPADELPAWIAHRAGDTLPMHDAGRGLIH